MDRPEVDLMKYRWNLRIIYGIRCIWWTADSLFIFASAKSGFAVRNIDDEKKDMQPLFDTILESIPAPEGDIEAPTQLLISTIDYNEYVGRIGIGKLENGTIKLDKKYLLLTHDRQGR